MNIIVKMHDRVRVIETTRMDLHSGIMLEDDFLDISDYLNQGVLLERSVFITTSDDMQLLKRAVTIIEPDELEAVEGVYADGKPILVRTEDGSRLAASVFEVLFDDSGNFMGDHGQGLCIYYESGSYETIVPTVLSFGDGMLMADDLIDWSDLDSGITWTRGAWTRGDRNLMELRPEPTVVVDPEQYAHMELMTFGGQLVAMKTAEGMVSGGGTVSDDSPTDVEATESEPQPSHDAQTVTRRQSTPETATKIKSRWKTAPIRIHPSPPRILRETALRPMPAPNPAAWKSSPPVAILWLMTVRTRPKIPTRTPMKSAAMMILTTMTTTGRTIRCSPTSSRK